MTMRALVYERYGPPSVLRLAQLPQPEPGPGEVLVKVRAASVNSWDWDLLTGTAQGRLGSPRKPPRPVLGADVAGTVEALGEGVTSVHLGDPVFGDLSAGRWGAFSDFALARADELARIPRGLDFIDAASIPQAGALALQGLRRKPGLDAGSSVLVNGAGGGVGTFAVQLAKALGVRVTAVDRAEKGGALLGLGADRFIDFRTTDFAAEAEQYDLILDVVARRSPWRFAKALKDGGTLSVIGGTIPALLGVAALGPLVGRLRRQSLGLLIYRVSVADNVDMAQRAASGKLKPVIDSVYPLEHGAEALARLGGGQAVGKVIITTDR